MSSTSNKNTNTTSKIDSAQSASSSNKQSIPQIQTHSQSTSNQQHHSQQHGHHLSHHSSQQHSQQQKPHGIPVSSSQSQKQHLVPPRYQPPPPVSGILKNISARSGIPTLNHQSHSAAETNTAHHLNLKFPQEVPKLTAVYIPDSVRTGNPSRIATRSLQHPRQSLNSVQQQQQSQQPSPQSQQVSTDDEQTTSRANAAHQSQQQQEMLKFVRKSDTDSVSAHSPNPSTSSSSNNFNRMTSGEQNRHFQVSFLFFSIIKKVLQLILIYFYSLWLRNSVHWKRPISDSAMTIKNCAIFAVFWMMIDKRAASLHANGSVSDDTQPVWCDRKFQPIR